MSIEIVRAIAYVATAITILEIIVASLLFAFNKWYDIIEVGVRNNFNNWVGNFVLPIVVVLPFTISFSFWLNYLFP